MTGAMTQKRRPLRPLDEAQLRDLALTYVGRFATTRARLERYLRRKIAERGWDGADWDGAAEQVAQAMLNLGYVDDAAWAGMTARALSRRGYGARRIDQSLWAAGVDAADRTESHAIVAETRLDSALRLAQRRRWGPYATAAECDPRQREKQVAAFLRAGHDVAIARRILSLAPGADISELMNDDASARLEEK